MKGLEVLFLVSVVFGEAPYPPSGSKPSGERFRLPIRNLKQQQEPNPAYGPPSTEAPVTEFSGYNYPPPAEPGVDYGPPQDPDGAYGPPQQPGGEYGAPEQPDSGYGAPEQPDVGYPAPEQPDSGYGAPEQPDNGYGPPQDPNNGYPSPGGEYGAPPEGSGAPLDPGATEKLRQNQFFQQLPLFESSRFIKPNNRLRRPQNFQNFQNFQSQPQNFQRQRFQAPRQNFRQQPTLENIRQVNKNQIKNAQSLKYRTVYRTISDEDYKKFPERLRKSKNLDVETFDSKILAKPLRTNRFQKQDTPNGLYIKPELDATTKSPKVTKRNKRPKPSNDPKNDEDGSISPGGGTNIAVSTAVAGYYNILQPDGTLPFKTSNEQLVDGPITSNIFYRHIHQPFTAYYFSEY